MSEANKLHETLPLSVIDNGKADFIAKLQIALKEANEIGYWLELLYKTDYLKEDAFKALDAACTSIRVMLISSINTAKTKTEK